MFTKNFMIVMATKAFNIAGSTSTTAPTKLYAVSTQNNQNALSSTGTTTYTSINNLSVNSLNFEEEISAATSNGQYRLSVMCGTGTTKPTIDDIKLENVIPRTSLEVPQIYYDPASIMNEQCLSFTSLHKNITNEDIVINELGLYSAGNYSTSGGNLILIWREVLDQPITIQAGKSKSITITLDFSKING